MSTPAGASEACDHGASYGNGDGSRTCLTCGDVFPTRPEDAMPWDSDPTENAPSHASDG